MAYSAARRGLAADPPSPIINTGLAVSGTAISAMGTLASMNVLSFSAIGGPFGIALAGIGLAIFGILSKVFGLGSGCGQTCVMATSVVNQLEPKLQQALNAYMSQPVHTQSMQSAYLQFFDAVWAAVQEGCGAGALAGTTAGRDCVADRQAGACKWKSSDYGWINGKYVPSGPAGSGSMCWNWVSGYRDPVANDPTVVPDTTSSTLTTAAGSVASVLGLPSSDATPLLWAAGLLVAAFVVPRFL